MLAPPGIGETSPVPNFAGVKCRASGGLAEVVAIVCTMERAPGDRREAEIRTAGLVGCGNVSSEDSGLDDPLIALPQSKASISSMKTRLLEVVKLLTTKEATTILGCHLETLYQWVKQGKIGCIRTGRNPEVPPQHIQEYLSGRAAAYNRVEPSAQTP